MRIFFVIAIFTTNILLGGTMSSFVQVDSVGNSYAVWLYSANNDGNFVVQAATAPLGGSWSTITTLSPTLSVLSLPTLVVNDGGDVVVMWVDTNGSTNLNAVYAAMYPSSSQMWTSTTTINCPGSVLLNPVHVDMNDSGQITATWCAFIDAAGSDTATYSASTTISPNNTWPTPTKISP